MTDRRDGTPGARRLPRALAGAAALAMALGLGGAARHPLHVSVTNLDHNAATGTVEISARVFTDDLEAALHARTGRALRLGTPREDPAADRLLFGYLSEHLRLGGAAPAVWVGREAEDGATWLYAEVPLRGTPRSLDVRNTLLMDLYADQTNLVHARAGRATASAALRRGRESATLAF